MIILVAILGELSPFYSYEVIPFTAALFVVDAKLNAVTAFWLVFPLMDPASLLLTSCTLSRDFAVAKTVSTVRIGVLGGPIKIAFSKRAIFSNPL